MSNLNSTQHLGETQRLGETAYNVHASDYGQVLDVFVQAVIGEFGTALPSAPFSADQYEHQLQRLVGRDVAICVRWGSSDEISRHIGLLVHDVDNGRYELLLTPAFNNMGISLEPYSGQGTAINVSQQAIAATQDHPSGFIDYVVSAVVFTAHQLRSVRSQLKAYQRTPTQTVDTSAITRQIAQLQQEAAQLRTAAATASVERDRAVKERDDALAQAAQWRQQAANSNNSNSNAAAAAAASSSASQQQLEVLRANVADQRQRIAELQADLARAQRELHQQQQQQQRSAAAAASSTATAVSGMRDYSADIRAAAPSVPRYTDLVSFAQLQFDLIDRGSRGSLLSLLLATHGVDARASASAVDGYKRAYVDLIEAWMALSAELAAFIAPHNWATSDLCRVGDKILMLLNTSSKQLHPQSVQRELLKKTTTASGDSDNESTTSKDDAIRAALSAASRQRGSSNNGGRGGGRRKRKNGGTGRASSAASKSQQ